MNSKSIFYLLNYWLDVLYTSTIDHELDQRTHGPDPRKNAATWMNQMRMQNSAIEVTKYLRLARALVECMPTPENVESLAQCEDLFNMYLQRCDPTYVPPPPNHHEENDHARDTLH